ncbi:MAG: hypothetical protein LBN36_03830 [Clostridiales Family XIII bacterium]|jgi:hypothetical protein|nr:hypothetical protein [Clostridiales Family XIII bacterium]
MSIQRKPHIECKATKGSFIILALCIALVFGLASCGEKVESVQEEAEPLIVTTDPIEQIDEASDIVDETPQSQRPQWVEEALEEEARLLSEGEIPYDGLYWKDSYNYTLIASGDTPYGRYEFWGTDSYGSTHGTVVFWRSDEEFPDKYLSVSEWEDFYFNILLAACPNADQLTTFYPTAGYQE